MHIRDSVHLSHANFKLSSIALTMLSCHILFKQSLISLIHQFEFNFFVLVCQYQISFKPLAFWNEIEWAPIPAINSSSFYNDMPNASKLMETSILAKIPFLHFSVFTTVACYRSECLKVKWMQLCTLWFLSVLTSFSWIFTHKSQCLHLNWTQDFGLYTWRIVNSLYSRLRIRVHLHFTFWLKPTNYLSTFICLSTYCAIVILIWESFFVHLLSKLLTFNDCCFEHMHIAHAIIQWKCVLSQSILTDTASARVHRCVWHASIGENASAKHDFPFGMKMKFTFFHFKWLKY